MPPQVPIMLGTQDGTGQGSLSSVLLYILVLLSFYKVTVAIEDEIKTNDIIIIYIIETKRKPVLFLPVEVVKLEDVFSVLSEEVNRQRGVAGSGHWLRQTGVAY